MLAARAQARSALTGLFLALGGVAVGVGGIGIANIMVISVLERRAEIGLRRALGATRRQVAVQFLTESVLLSVLGGLGGVLLGAAATVGYALSTGQAVVVPAAAAGGGLAVSLAVGAVAEGLPGRAGRPAAAGRSAGVVTRAMIPVNKRRHRGRPGIRVPSPRPQRSAGSGPRCALLRLADFTGSFPWRRFRSVRGQAYYSGSYVSATTGGHVLYESRLELARLLLADFDRRHVHRYLGRPIPKMIPTGYICRSLLMTCIHRPKNR